MTAYKSKALAEAEPSNALNRALDVVASINDAGMATVPIKPSATMLTEGAKAGGVSVEQAWCIYQAMIRSAE